MALLELTGVSKKEGENLIVNDISFTLQPFQKIAVAGETGSGKTTLLKMIAGLVQPDAGYIRIHGERVAGPDEKLLPGHPSIAYLSQYFELRNNYRVEEELEAKNLLPEDEARAIYRICRISHLLKRGTGQVSGGERQRIVLAGLLVTSPKLLLLDEPFSNLDTIHKNIIQSVIRDIGEQLGITCLMVSHDAADMLSWADTILVMRNGQIIQQGAARDIYYQPANEYCAALLGEYNLIDAGNADASYFAAAGTAPGKKVFLRPEQWIISAKKDGALEAVVQESLFHGPYYILKAMMGDQLVFVNTRQSHFKKGDALFLQMTSAASWYL